MLDTQSAANMNARAEVVMGLFPQITASEWLLALAIKLDSAAVIHNRAKMRKGSRGGPVYEPVLWCHHCAKKVAHSAYGMRRHHTNKHKKCTELCETLRSLE